MSIIGLFGPWLNYGLDTLLWGGAAIGAAILFFYRWLWRQKTMEAEGKKATVVAQHRNIDAEVHLREMLKEIQNNQAFETLANMEKKATEASTLAKVAAEADVAYQNAALEREFSGYAEEASIDKDLTDWKNGMNIGDWQTNIKHSGKNRNRSSDH
ncbi:hypothetical protein F4167_04470 [Candidatus Poribacteria bacterium]|nr:hypothetical protein [Candidatus Poribacteria bacterium]